ncbi:MAG: ABC transporter substrate-binding protein, partial [Bdellovibrionales bacterium]|nr:ABC transporter substrate-binding protein [Bdellovibrionales bacterium]
VVALGAASSMLTASFAQASVKRPTTFVYCSEGSPRTFNPQMGMDGPTFNASSRTIYNRLVDFEKGGTKVVPSLAESWAVSKDGKQITFKLRKDVEFQTTAWFKPSRAFNADDVLFTFNRMFRKDHPFHKVNGGVYEYFTSMDMNKLIMDIKKVDDHTVVFVLSRPETPFLANMAMDFASILSAEYGDALLKSKTPERIDQQPIGTGPFQFVRYEKDSQIRYEAHPKYFEGKAAIDRLVFAITVDPNVRAQKLKRGECQFVAEPSVLDVTSLRKETKVSVVEQEGLNVGYLAINVEKKPLGDVRVRQAIAMALNKKTYIDAIYQGQASAATNPIPPSMWSYNKAIKDTPFDTVAAKKLLADAGFPNGFETTLWYMPVSRPYNPNAKKMAEMMQADLATVGIKAKLVSYEWGTYLDKARNGEHDLLLIGWTGDNGDPDNFMGTLLGCAGVKGGSNYSRWCNKDFDRLINGARQASDLATRTKQYEQAQEIFKRELPWVTIAHAKVFRAMEKRVKGYSMSPFGTDAFYGVSVESKQ